MERWLSYTNEIFKNGIFVIQFKMIYNKKQII